MSGDFHRTALRWGVLGLAAAAAFVAWLATRDHEPFEPTSREAAPARILTPAELSEAEGDLGQPIYWLGPLPRREVVLKDLGEAGVQVRYLPKGTTAGQGSRSLTIGSYPLADPEATMREYAERPGSIARRASDGSLLVTSDSNPSSVYLADPANAVQIEVYDPSPRRAMSLARSDRLRPAAERG